MRFEPSQVFGQDARLMDQYESTNQAVMFCHLSAFYPAHGGP